MTERQSDSRINAPRRATRAAGGFRPHCQSRTGLTYLSYCNGPHCWAGRRVWTPALSCMHASCPPRGCGSGWASASRFPRPRESLSVLSCLTGPSLPSSSQLLSVPSLHVATTAYGHVEQRLGPTQSDKTFPSALPPMLRATACLPSCIQLSWNPFYKALSAVRVQAVSFKSLRSWHQSPCLGTRVRGPYRPMGFQNKTSPVRLPPFSNRARLSCSTNLNITRLISQARDMKPAVGSPSSALLL